jgi:tetratricopeptide (TPR) repeat protein
MSSKKNTHKNKPHIQKEKNVVENIAIDKRLILKLSFLIALFSFILYSNTLSHGFVLDDNSIIKENQLTQGGIHSLKTIFVNSYREGYGNNENNLYRPLTKAMFAIEWQISPNNPHFHHLINVLLFSLTCVLLFIVLLRYTKINPYLLFFVVLLFAAHPIHTEVVANIKSRDEIASMLFILLSLLCISKYLSDNKIIMLIASLGCFFLALLSKESAIIFVAIAPLFIYFFTETSFKKIITITGSAATVALLYIGLHIKILGSIGIKIIPIIDNSLLAAPNFIQQKATAIYIMGKYLLLLLFPHPLSCDYSFNTIPTVSSFGNFGFLLAISIHLFLLYYAIKKWKEKSFFSFCILFYLISMAMASNIFMLIGTHLAERLLFFPSITFCLALVYFICKLLKIDFYNPVFALSKNTTLVAVCLLILIPYSLKTFSRNKDWKSDTTLFAKDIKTVPNSSHMLFYYANNLANQDSLDVLSPEMKNARLSIALTNINKALAMYDLFPDAHNVAGRIYYAQNDFQSALKSYSRAMQMSPNKSIYHNNVGTALFAVGKYPEAAKEFQNAFDLNKYYAEAVFNLGSAYGAMGEIAKNSGDAAKSTQLFTTAIDRFQKAISMKPNYKSAYQFIGMTYRNMGDSANAKTYLDKAASIKK